MTTASAPRLLALLPAVYREEAFLGRYLAAFEEVLLGGTVERYRPSIQTQHVRTISDIDDQDCTELDAGMEKSSKWLAGHDLARQRAGDDQVAASA